MDELYIKLCRLHTEISSMNASSWYKKLYYKFIISKLKKDLRKYIDSENMYNLVCELVNIHTLFKYDDIRNDDILIETSGKYIQIRTSKFDMYNFGYSVMVNAGPLGGLYGDINALVLHTSYIRTSPNMNTSTLFDIDKYNNEPKDDIQREAYDIIRDMIYEYMKIVMYIIPGDK